MPTSLTEALWLQEGQVGVILVVGLVHAPQSRAEQPVPANKYEQIRSTGISGLAPQGPLISTVGMGSDGGR